MPFISLSQNIAHSIQLASSVTSSTSIPRLRIWAENCRSLYPSEGFSLGTPIFLSRSLPNFDFALQDLSRRAIKHQPLARKNGQPLSSQLTLNKVFLFFIYNPRSRFKLVKNSHKLCQGRVDMFYFFCKIIFRFNKEKDDIRNA